MNVKLLCKTIGMSLKNHAPEIMMFAGAAAVTTGAVIACKKTLELPETLKVVQTEWDNLKKDYPEKTGADYRKAVFVASGKTAKEFIKLYGPSALIFAGGMAAMFSSNAIVRKRLLVAAATAEAIKVSYDNYRKNVVKEFGSEIDRKMFYGYSNEKVTKAELDEESGELKEVSEIVKESDGNGQLWTILYSEERCPGSWRPGPGYNKMFIEERERALNMELQRKGWLYLKDVLKSLGYMDPVYIVNGVDVSTTYGWIWCDERQDMIDFGLYDIEGNQAKGDFLREIEPNVWLDLNVSGDITRLVPTLMYREAMKRDKETPPWAE